MLKIGSVKPEKANTPSKNEKNKSCELTQLIKNSLRKMLNYLLISIFAKPDKANRVYFCKTRLIHTGTYLYGR
jgi:hypothetical protein